MNMDSEEDNAYPSDPLVAGAQVNNHEEQVRLISETSDRGTTIIVGATVAVATIGVVAVTIATAGIGAAPAALAVVLVV